MATVDETKSRLLRGIVQDNIDVLQNVKVRRLNRRKRLVRPWILAGLLVMLGVYVAQTELIVSTAPTTVGSPVALATGAVTPSEIEQTPELSTPLTNPRPIDRSAIPLAIKRIVIDPGHGGEPGATSESGVAKKKLPWMWRCGYAA
jgi:N-acetylmuramoyl-L-alanine amidase